MGKKPPPEKPNPAEQKGNCKTCGQPLGSHTINQLAECAAQRN